MRQSLHVRRWYSGFAPVYCFLHIVDSQKHLKAKAGLYPLHQSKRIGTLQFSGLDGDFTCERGPRRMPLLLLCRLARAEVDALRPEFCGTTRLRRATVDVRLTGDLEVNEARSHDRGFQFCLQQSTSNSACPQIDLLFRVLWHRLLHQDIPDLEAAGGCEHASHLLQGREFVRKPG